MKKGENNEFVTQLYTVFIYFIDLCIILFSIYMAFMIKFNFNPPSFNYQPFVNIIPWIAVIYLLYMYVFGSGNIVKQSFGEIIYSIIMTVIVLTLAIVFLTFFNRGFAYPRTVIICSAVFQLVLLSLWRTVVWKLRIKVHGIKDSIVIGNDSADYISKKIILKQKKLYRIKYICSPESPRLMKYLEDVEVVFLCNDIDFNIKDMVVDYSLTNRKSIYLVPDVYEIALLNSKLNKIDDVPVLKIQKLGLTLEQKFIKRLIDIASAAVLILLSSPIMLVMTVLIKLYDGGTILYKQERVTEGDRKFNMYKFRTMVMNAEKLSGPKLADENDPRITKIGRFMRSTRIDELPQFFNILMGDMSIVGPRPEREFFINKFKETIPDFKYRTIVKAGLTGLAQVWGKYSTTPEDKIKYDILYIKNYSVLMDIKLIFQTVKIMFTKESSSGVKEDCSLEKLIDELSIDIVLDR